MFVSNLFSFTRLMSPTNPGSQPMDARKRLDLIRDISTFCFQGLGLEYEAWGKTLEVLVLEGGLSDEGL